MYLVPETFIAVKPTINDTTLSKMVAVVFVPATFNATNLAGFCTAFKKTPVNDLQNNDYVIHHVHITHVSINL